MKDYRGAMCDTHALVHHRRTCPVCEAEARLTKVIQYGDHLAREASESAGLGSGHLVDAIEAWRSVSLAAAKGGKPWS